MINLYNIKISLLIIKLFPIIQYEIVQVRLQFDLLLHSLLLCFVPSFVFGHPQHVCDVVAVVQLLLLCQLVRCVEL